MATEKTVAEILAYLREAYPGTLKDATTATRRVWMDVCRDMDDAILWEAARRCTRHESLLNTATLCRQYEEVRDLMPTPMREQIEAPRLENDRPVDDARALEYVAKLKAKLGNFGAGAPPIVGENETARRKRSQIERLN